MHCNEYRFFWLKPSLSTLLKIKIDTVHLLLTIHIQIRIMKTLCGLILSLFEPTVFATFTEEILKACVHHFSLFLKDKCISSLFRTKYIEKKFKLQLFFLPTVSRKFILSRATKRYPPP